MVWRVSTVAIVVFGGAALSIAVGLKALQKESDPLSAPLAVAMFAVAAWAIPHAISLGYTDVERVVFWHRLRYPGTVLAPVAYLVLALRYAGYERWLSHRTYAGLGVIPVVTVLVVWTNQYHGLFWQSLSVESVGNASVFLPEFGQWYWVNLGYLYMVTTASLALFAAAVIRLGALYRKQAALMFASGLLPLMTNVAITFDLLPIPSVDFTTTALAVSGLLIALTLFHFDLLELQPVARNWLVDVLDDGVVVVDMDGRIRDFNPTAVQVLGDITIKQPAEEVLPSVILPDGGGLVVEESGELRRFRMHSTPLTDRRGHRIGRIIYLTDITELVEREQRISVLNRTLRHNIRNELNIATGYLEQLESQGVDDEHNHVERARKSINQVIEFAEKARHVEQTLQRTETETEAVVSATEIVQQVVADASETYVDATIQYDPVEETGNEPSVRMSDAELLEVVTTELVKNAVVHNDKESPRVAVSVESADELVRVKVADNGPGIPDHEQEVLTARTETHLEHGSGLGLWLLKWAASRSSGELTFSENDPCGTVVTVPLPAAD